MGKTIMLKQVAFDEYTAHRLDLHRLAVQHLRQTFP